MLPPCMHVCVQEPRDLFLITILSFVAASPPLSQPVAQLPTINSGSRKCARPDNGPLNRHFSESLSPPPAPFIAPPLQLHNSALLAFEWGGLKKRWLAGTHSEREACCCCTADDHLVALPSRLSPPPPPPPPRAAARSPPTLFLRPSSSCYHSSSGLLPRNGGAGAIGAGAERFREQIGG